MNMRNKMGRKLFKRSTIAACVMAVTAAHAQAQETNNDDPALLEEVVVYGIKQSLQDAQAIKREASTVQDVITASDIGSLPDKSVVEALQRVPGVAIERFEASDDPDHFSVEGGNVTVRGLNRVRGEINGRDGFSATGDGGLNYSDIPPEIVGSVIVNKSQSAKLIEGGISGTINIETRKPFDSDELVLGGTIKASYADLIDEVKPSASGIVSNVWDTDAGKFGALLSVAYSEFSSRADGVGVYNYKAVTNLSSNPDGENLFAPIGGSARQAENNRQRLGIAGSLQWANPSETVQTTLEFIRSDSDLTWTEHFLEYAAQPFDNAAGSQNINIEGGTYNCPESNDITNQPCLFDSGLIIGGLGGNPADSDQAFQGDPYYISAARARTDKRIVNDLSFNLEYVPSDNLKIVGDVQYVLATNDVTDFGIHSRINSTDAFLDLRGSDEPQFELLDKNDGTTNAISDPASYFLRSAIDHIAENEGDELAFQLDAEYSFDDSVITSVEAGVRASNRTLDFKESLYNWGSLSETWQDPGNPVRFSDLLETGLVEQFTFEDHLNGGSLTVNDTFYAPSVAALSNPEAFYQALVDNNVLGAGASSWVPLSQRASVTDGTPFRPAELATVEEDRSSFYVQVNFGNEDATTPFSGDAGLRYVNWQLSSTGANVFGAADEIFSGETNNFLQSFPYTEYWIEREFDWQGPGTEAFYTNRFYDTYLQEATAAGEADPAAFATARIAAEVAAVGDAKEALLAEVNGYLDQQDGEVYTTEGEKFTRVLPSFNLKLGLTDEFITRFAFSESIFLPTLDKVRNNRLVTPNLQVTRFEDLDTGNELTTIQSVELTGYVANGGGNPLLQPELSTNYDLTFEYYFEDFGSVTSSIFYKRIRDYFRQSSVIEELANSTGQVESVVVTSTQNAGTATVQGFELAYQSSFGFIDESLEDFGLQASYTFIDGSAEDEGNPQFGGDPDNKYAAQFTFNNIRDLPLEGLSQDNYNIVAYYDNQESFQARFAYNWRSSYLLNSRDVIAFAPVYGDSTGQLDFSMSYKLNDNLRVGVEANNILNEITRTSIDNEIDPATAEYNQETIRSPRSYFANDRRLAVFLQANF
jgi:TonB-dependent receptor